MSSGREGLFANVTEVMVNRPDDVYVERAGLIEKVEDRLFEGRSF
jgi:type IV secretory pathway ATPase VirB11/archaellum biosynthesis ATPase